MSVELGGELVEPIEATVGQRIVGWSQRRGGLTHALTGVADLADGSSVFVKAATNDSSAAEIHNEIAFLDAVDASYLPQRLGTLRGHRPAVILEDLSAGHWPEPYPEDLGPLEEVLDAIRSTPVPSELDLPILEGPTDEMYTTFVENARTAAPEISAWAERYVDVMVAAPTRRPGHALIHGDLWYSNVCFVQDRVVVVDWSHARRGSPWFDASTVGIDLVICGRRPLPMEEAAAWAVDHLVWSIWSLAQGPWPAIAHPSQWRLDNLELVDGAAWWAAHELGLPAPPVITDRRPGWE